MQKTSSTTVFDAVKELCEFFKDRRDNRDNLIKIDGPEILRPFNNTYHAGLILKDSVLAYSRFAGSRKDKAEPSAYGKKMTFDVLDVVRINIPVGETNIQTELRSGPYILFNGRHNVTPEEKVEMKKNMKGEIEKVKILCWTDLCCKLLSVADLLGWINDMCDFRDKYKNSLKANFERVIQSRMQMRFNEYNDYDLLHRNPPQTFTVRSSLRRRTKQQYKLDVHEEWFTFTDYLYMGFFGTSQFAARNRAIKEWNKFTKLKNMGLE